MDRPTPPPRGSASEGPSGAKGKAASGNGAKPTGAKTPAAKTAAAKTARTKAPVAKPRAASPKRPVAAQRRVDVRGWLGGIRVSGFVVIMLGLVVLGTFVLVPTVGTYMDQRQQIQALKSAVAVSQSEVADLQAQRERWSDPAYITTQARERLYYTMPGEVVFLIDDDLPASTALQEQPDVSGDVGQTRTDWMSQFMRSLTSAGAAQVVVPTVGVPDPTPAPASTPAP
ncbi:MULTISPECIES: septum formation initiator family protein [Microbacterium]|uniref:FtsB family cell division protein n=1 Tax=Microbacterium TaxID=33882 RepID=UPI0027893C9D|nr:MULTISPECIES: septum formation initiator family protein [Microbacterium]MDQ1076477.1 cell division protein FtsB [Microbacterium sp. SORGH_AS_0969]MDQ1116712.1 cell division protein FtsB [Microbacterium testaceum]